MNKIQKAYEQELKVRKKEWDKKEWIKKHSETDSIDESGDILSNYWSFIKCPRKWEIWHEDEHLFNQPNIKAQIQTHLNQIQELLKQL